MPRDPTRPITSRLEENRVMLEEAMAISRRIHGVIEVDNEQPCCEKQVERSVNCIVDDVDKQHYIIGEIPNELNDIGRIVGY